MGVNIQSLPVILYLHPSILPEGEGDIDRASEYLHMGCLKVPVF